MTPRPSLPKRPQNRRESNSHGTAGHHHELAADGTGHEGSACDQQLARVGDFSQFLNGAVTYDPLTAAVPYLISLPVIMFGLIVQRYLVRGMTFGAVK